ncbi:MAG: UDP-N-acetylmuramoyl-L-alanyl-D-glutamate--2,6-diaminopimelate ligase, partial [Rhodospirillales bacterium]|nr:UDP-N-acetylmuramoyl-L-alanyl-D-glutamate--2,6-diaminopimelate ligase [Rhodospirillales bacterium]
MNLIDLLSGDKVDIAGLTEFGQTEITGLTCDSRRVRPGFLFAAFPGEQADGREFIPEAVGRGAAAVLAPPGTRLHPPSQATRLLTVENPRRIFSLMAARFYELQPSIVAAVTGTNGKTSVVTFLRQIWTQLGRRAASMGTLGITAPDFEKPGNLTTPDSAELHRQLRNLVDAGVDRLAMEASSHGLAQYRLDGVRINAAAFTNLSRDHLDYHGSMEAYGAAKLRLVVDLTAADGSVVINADDPMSEAFSIAARGRGLRVITYGRAGQNIRLLSVEPSETGQTLQLECFGQTTTVELPLVGSFQASNALCALGLAVACGEKPKRVAEALGSLQGVRGRMELCARHRSGAAIFVDYAHTPDALRSVLQAVRPHTRGRLFVVFGCGGDRDPGKRPQMGEIAKDLADSVVVTDDNP